jgi:hypothetical protein
MPTPIDASHTADLDRPFPSFSLTSNGRVYTIEIERLHSQHLYHGVLEWCPMDPEDSADELAEYHRKELDAAQRLAKDLALLWPGWKSPTMLTPTPDWRDPEFQHGSRWQGHLWAATLRSPDDFFPIPFRGGGAPQPADYSEADILYATRLGEGPLPQRVRDAIDWERVAKPQLF